MTTITWLHFSDIHLCNPKSAWEADMVLNALRKDLLAMQHDHGLQPDFIVFTGDAVFGQIGKEKGKAITDQFENAELLFSEIREIYDPPVPIDHFFIVPGNHDVNREKVNELLYNGFDKRLSDKDYPAMINDMTRVIHDAGREWQDFLAGLSDYHSFLKQNGYTPTLDPERLIYAANLDIHGIKIGLAGMNSAWSSGFDRKKGQLWLAGHYQVQTLSKSIDSSHIKIALIHHPGNWLNQAEDPHVHREMENHFDFLLHGHEHQNWVNENANGFTCISAGACYGDSTDETGYNLVRLFPEQGRGEVWLRKYDHGGEGWIPAAISKKTNNDGMWPINQWAQRCRLSSRILSAPSVPLVQQGRSSQSVAATEEGRTERLLVGTTEDRPFNPIAPDGVETLRLPRSLMSRDNPEYRGVFGRGKEIRRIAENLSRTPIVAICGLSGVGKTVLINEVVNSPSFRALEHIRLKVYGDMSLGQLFRHLAPSLGCRDETPRAKFKLLNHLDFSPLAKFARHSSPVIIHLEDAQKLLSRGSSKFLFRDPDIKEFLVAITEHYTETRVVLESREMLSEDLFPVSVYKFFKIRGIDRESMSMYFQRPFKDDTEKGWNLDIQDQDFIYKKLGGNRQSERAHPLSMALLANVADGMKETPRQVLERYDLKRVLVLELEERLFRDLYENVLTPSAQRMLRLCALYREDIPDEHVGFLSKTVRDNEAFQFLLRRYILTPNSAGDCYTLHAIISDLTQNRVDNQTDEFFEHHQVIANAWLSRLRMSSHFSRPNIRAANEALHHLVEGKCYDRLHEITESLLDLNVLPSLERTASQLAHAGQYAEDRVVLELILRLDKNNHKAHRFLGEAIERLEGKGNEIALRHYEEAHRLDPAFPPYLGALGSCLLERGDPESFILLVESLDTKTYKKVMGDINLAIYANCHEAVNRGTEASRLRTERIQAGSLHSVFFNDEAKYLAKIGKIDEALKILDKAIQKGCSNEYTHSIKAGILQQAGSPKEASMLRMERIRVGSRSPVFFNDEAKYLAQIGKAEEALQLLEKAAQEGCNDKYTHSIKAGILEQAGRSHEASKIRMEDIQAGSRNAALYCDEAKYLVQIGKSDEALQLLEKASEEGCNDEHIQLTKATIFQQIGRPQDASRLRMKRIMAGTRDTAFYCNEAYYLAQNGRLDEALQIIEKAAHEGCKDEYYFSIKAGILQQLGRSREASKLRVERIQAGSREPVFFCEEAKYLAQINKFDEALQLIDKAIQKGCSNEYTYSIKAGVLQQTGKPQEASMLRMERIGVDAQNPALYCDEAKYLAQIGKTDDALQLLKKADEKGCTNDYTHSIKAVILQQTGRTQEASMLRMERIRAGSRHPALYCDEAKYLAQIGKTDDALQLLKKADEEGCSDEYTEAVRADIKRTIKSKS